MRGATRTAAAVAFLLAGAFPPARGQAPGPEAPAVGSPETPAAGTRTAAASAATGDTLRLGALHRAVRRRDPRFRQLDLRERATAARLRRLGTRWRPALGLGAEASYQTEVPTAVSPGAGGGLPPGFDVPVPPKERWEAALEVEQLLYDGGGVARSESVERARLSERKAETRMSLYELRAEVDRAFFAALLQQERRRQLELLLEDLDARRRTVAARVRAGSLVPSQLAAVDAERIEARQDLERAEAGRRAALDRISLLLERDVGPGAVLSVPELARRADSLRREVAGDGGSAAGGPSWTRRPAWTRLARLEDRLLAEASLAEAENRPRASAFVRGAVGRPGLDFFDDEVSTYATAGIRVRWSFFDWGGSDARARALRLQAEAAAADRAALGDALRRRAVAVAREIDRLARALGSDGRIVSLREQRRRTALRQLEEGVLLPAEYVERRTDVFEARLRRRTHRVQLAEARARLLRVAGGRVPGRAAADVRMRMDPWLPLLPEPGASPR